MYVQLILFNEINKTVNKTVSSLYTDSSSV